MDKLYVLLGALLIVPASFAQDVPVNAVNHTESDTRNIYVGAGFSNKLVHLNAEWVNPYGIAYAKAGAFLSGDRVPGGQIGFRHPVYLTATEKNGYYVGAYAGYVDRKWLDGDDEARLGAGVDLAYVMLTRDRISTFSVGVAAAEKMTDSTGKVIADVEPKLQFSYTLSFGL
jgi:hypothetical protein